MSLLGKPAPDFTLPSDKRVAVTLSSFHGKKVILAFYPAAFTGVCSKEVCAFRDALADLNEANATVLGISVDAPFSNAAFAEKNGLNFPLLSDYARNTVRAYGVVHEDFAGMPGYIAAKRSVFVISEKGTVTYEWVAPNPGVEPNYEEVVAATR